MDIETIPELLNALHAKTPTITLHGPAAKLVQTVLVLHTKTFSPFMRFIDVTAGIIGNALNQDFADHEGEQTGQMMQLSQGQMQQYGLTPDNAVFLVHTANEEYRITPKPVLTFTLIKKQHPDKNQIPDQYSKYLQK